MGSCSNRELTSTEKNFRDVQTICNRRYEDRFNSMEAAFIRGRMGTEKGNNFIDTMYKLTKT